VNTAYPVGSVNRSRDLWEELPRESGLMPEDDGLGCCRGLACTILIYAVAFALGWMGHAIFKAVSR